MGSAVHHQSQWHRVGYRLVWAAVVALFLGTAPNAAQGGDEGILWEDIRSDEGSLRRATFLVSDGACAYEVMAVPRLMGSLFRHVKKLVVHSIQGTVQDVSVHERFFLVGNVESRYHRFVHAANRVEWRLVSGRQARHDGVWIVNPLDDGAARITFENLIKAKYAIHQGLLRRIQERTMSDIVDVVVGRCGAGGVVPPGSDEAGRKGLFVAEKHSLEKRSGVEPRPDTAEAQSR